MLPRSFSSSLHVCDFSSDFQRFLLMHEIFEKYSLQMVLLSRMGALFLVPSFDAAALRVPRGVKIHVFLTHLHQNIFLRAFSLNITPPGSFPNYVGSRETA